MDSGNKTNRKKNTKIKQKRPKERTKIRKREREKRLRQVDVNKKTIQEKLGKKKTNSTKWVKWLQTGRNR